MKKGFSSRDRILEIGSNDGTLIEELRLHKLKCIGVDPAENIIEYSRKLGHEVINESFSNTLVEKYGFSSKFDLIISCNSFAHITNIREVSRAISNALRIGGSFCVEVQSWEELVKKRAFDFIYHEHKYYYDLNSLRYLLALDDMELLSAELVESHGGSWRCLFVKRERGTVKFTEEAEPKEESLPADFIQHMVHEFFESLAEVKELVLNTHKSGKGVVGFGASGRANMLLEYMKLEGTLRAVFDESPERIGRNMGFSGIPIRSFSSLDESDYTLCLVLAWNFFESIKEKWPHSGKVLLRPLPEVRIVDIHK